MRPPWWVWLTKSVKANKWSASSTSSVMQTMRILISGSAGTHISRLCKLRSVPSRQMTHRLRLLNCNYLYCILRMGMASMALMASCRATLRSTSRRCIIQSSTVVFKLRSKSYFTETLQPLFSSGMLWIWSPNVHRPNQSSMLRSRNAWQTNLTHFSYC